MSLRREVRDRYWRALLGLARNGHERAFRRLYRQLYEPVAGYVHARVPDADDADDLISIIFHKLLRGLDRYDSSRGSVWTWTMTLSRNAVIDFYRTRRETESLEDLGELLVGDGDDPLQGMIREEESRLLHGILADHPVEVREMFALRFGQGLRYGEIARVMGLSEAAVKQRFSRAMRGLRVELGSRDREGGEKDAIALENRRRVEDVA